MASGNIPPAQKYYFSFIFVVLIALGFSLLLSIQVGAARISFNDVWQALVSQNQMFEHLIVRTVRLPRVLAGALVGMALALAGSIRHHS